MVRLDEAELSKVLGPVLRNFPLGSLIDGAAVILARVDGDVQLPLLDSDRRALVEVLYRELLTRRLDRIDTLRTCERGHRQCTLGATLGPCGHRILEVLERGTA